MRPHRLARAIALLASPLLGLLGPGDAWAQPASKGRVCAEQQSRAAEARSASHLVAARDEALKCSDAACPKMIQDECAKLASEVAAALPSVVLVARLHDGGDVVEARVTVDGKPFAERLDGVAKEVDPGKHTFGFDTSDGLHAEITVLVVEGDRRKRVELTFPPKPAATSAPSSPPRGRTPAVTGAPSAPIPAVTFVLGGLGLVALGSYAYSGLHGRSLESDLEACKPRCPRDREAPISRSYLVADISLGVSVVSLAAATYFFVTSRSSPPAASRGSSWRVDVAGDRLLVGGAF